MRTGRRTKKQNILRIKGRLYLFAMGFMLLDGLGMAAADSPQTDRETAYRQSLYFASFVKGGSVEPHWMADGNSFWYAEGAPDETVIYRVDPESNTRLALFDVDKVREALAQTLGREPPYRGLPFDRFRFVDQEQAVRFAIEGREYVLQLDSYQVTRAPAESQIALQRSQPRVSRDRFPVSGGPVMELPSPDGRWLANEKDHNIWLRSTADDRMIPLTSDGADKLDWRLAPYATQPAWSGTAKWSPNGAYLAALKLDTQGVHQLPVVHWLKPAEEVEWIAYPQVGGKLPQTELNIVDVYSGQAVPVDDKADRDHSYYPVHWAPDASELYFLRHDRFLKRVDLMAANPVTGETRIIVTDEQKTFIAGLSFSSYNFFTPLGDGQHFIWMSERDGWKQLYLYDLQGNLVRRLTTGKFRVDQVIAVDDRDGWVYFAAQADPDHPWDTHLYRVDFMGKNFKQLTQGRGQHGTNLAKFPGLLVRPIQFSPSKKYFIDSHSFVDRPPAAELRKADGTLLEVLSQATFEPPAGFEWSPPEPFVVKAADGETDLYGMLYKPPGFDPNKRYPVIDALYGGPQISLVQLTYGSNQFLTQLGFIVFSVDARGTPGRSKAFQDVAYKSLGRHEIPDHVATLDQLSATRPYMDRTRVGLYGASFGGYFTARAMLLYPDVYHVGVSSMPVMELTSVRPGPIEPYMGLPQNNKEAYDYASNLLRAKDLKGKLLIVAGGVDSNAPFTHAMKMAAALQQADKPYDLMVLPDQNHNSTGSARLYYIDTMRRYFEEHLHP